MIYRKAFQRSNLQLQSGMYMYCDTNKNGVNISNVCKAYNVENCGSPINLFLLPEIYSDFGKHLLLFFLFYFFHSDTGPY